MRQPRTSRTLTSAKLAVMRHNATPVVQGVLTVMERRAKEARFAEAHRRREKRAVTYEQTLAYVQDYLRKAAIEHAGFRP